MATKSLALVLLCLMTASAQKSPYAGLRPIGYPELEKTTREPSSLVNKLGEETTQRLPVEAHGDRELIETLSKLPIDQQPFWFINWQALEAHRQKPQTYPQKPNDFSDSSFINSQNVLNMQGNPVAQDPAPVNPQSPDQNSEVQTTVGGQAQKVSNTPVVNEEAIISSQGPFTNVREDLGNRFGHWNRPSHQIGNDNTAIKKASLNNGFRVQNHQLYYLN